MSFTLNRLTQTEPKHVDEKTAASISEILGYKVLPKPMLEVDPSPLIEYLASQCTVISNIPYDCPEDEHPKVMVRCDEVIPWPLQVGFSWKPESKSIEQRRHDWENEVNKDLKQKFAIYLLNNWVPFGFFLKGLQGKEYKVHRPDGIKTSSEYAHVELQRIRNSENEEAP